MISTTIKWNPCGRLGVNCSFALVLAFLAALQFLLRFFLKSVLIFTGHSVIINVVVDTIYEFNTEA